MRSFLFAGRVTFALLIACLLSPLLAREITFEERVRAQEAIDRVRYGHQIGTTEPFEIAVPRAAIEQKVRNYLRQSAALEIFWKTPVTDEMLRRENERMAERTQMPERLVELYDALGNDPVLVRECLVRPALVDRLTRNFFAFDPDLHSQARMEADALRAALTAGKLGSAPADLSRSMIVLARSSGQSASRIAGPRRDASDEVGDTRNVELDSGAFDRMRQRLPRGIGVPSAVAEERDAFVLRVVTEESADQAHVLTYAIAKRSWDEWWAEVSSSINERGVASVKEEASSLPQPRADAGVSFQPETRGVAAATCRPEDSWDNGSLDDLPLARWGHSAVWTGTVMVVWGGNLSVGFTDSGGRYDPATDTWSPTSAVGAPSPRSGHSTVWTGSKVLVWGGSGPNGLSQGGGRYDPGTDTWLPITENGAPSPRYSHSAIWATGPGRMIVWGGADFTDGFLATGGQYNPANDTWTSTSTTGAPTPRFAHTAVWSGSKMIVWGGMEQGPASEYGTGGRYDPVSDSWTEVTPYGGPTTGHSSVWTGTRMAVWGPYGGSYDPVNDNWTYLGYSGLQWHSGQTVVWTGTQLLIWGGEDRNSATPSDGSSGTGARLDPESGHWSRIATRGAPSARTWQTAVWTGSRMIVWGGRDIVSTYGSTLQSGGRYDPATNRWTPTATVPGATGALGSGSVVWTGNWMIVWGGSRFGDMGSIGVPVSSGGRYDPVLDTWSATSMLAAPASRVDHTAVWTGSKMVIWGGREPFDAGFPSYNTYRALGSGGRYDPFADTWLPVNERDAPDPRFWHFGVWTGSTMVVWGGADRYDPTAGGSFLDDGGRYNPDQDTWLPVSTIGAPPAGDGKSAVWAGNRLVIWGGDTGVLPPPGLPGTGAKYDPTSDTWTPVSTTNAPSPRWFHTAVWTGSRVLIWGGTLDGYTLLQDGGQYDPASDTWVGISTVNAPDPRFFHVAVWTGSRMIVWGGRSSFFYTDILQTGGRYDPAANSWSPTATQSAPALSAYLTIPAAIWTGSSMIVWGGDESSRGGRYFLGGGIDNDLDGYTECQGDCNDGNPAVNPGRGESAITPLSCTDRIDNDCDGLADAADPACVGAASARFIDFGPGHVPPAPGYDRDDGSAFSSARGYGWQTTTGLIPARSRSCTDVPEPQRTFVLAYTATTWEIEIPNGDYDVTVSVGDCSFAQGAQRVEVEGVRLVSDEAVAAKQFLVRSRRVRVMDGRLTMVAGGTSAPTVLNSILIAPAPVQPAASRSINFQPENAPIPLGFTPDFGDPFDAAQGSGWSRSLITNVRARGKNLDAALDSLIFVSAPAATYEMVVPNAVYDVRLSVGDSQFAQGAHKVLVEGTALFDGETTAANVFRSATTRVRVSDGRLSVQMGGTAGTTTLNYLSVATARIIDLRVNFQPQGSEVPVGYQADWGATFDGSRGFGWQNSQVGRTRDRNVNADQLKDTMLFIPTPAQIWEAELPFGDYSVSISVGDSQFAQGPHKVTVEGVVVFNGDTTAGGLFLNRTVTVPVRDGRLTIAVGGGATGNTAINYLTVSSVDPPTPSALDTSGPTDGVLEVLDPNPALPAHERRRNTWPPTRGTLVAP